MSFLSKIAKPAAIIGGSYLLGNYLFPETFASVGLDALGRSAGASALASGGTAGIGPLASGADYASQLSSLSGIGGTAAASSSLFSNPTVLSSALLAGTSLISGLFGSTSEEDALAEQKRQFDASQTLSREKLAQDKELALAQLEAAKAQAGAASGAAAAARDAALRQARAQAITQAMQLRLNAQQFPAQAGQQQVQALQNQGAQSGAFFNNLIPNLQRAALA